MAANTIVNVGLGLLSAGAITVSVSYFNGDSGVPVQTIVQTITTPEGGNVELVISGQPNTVQPIIGQLEKDDSGGSERMNDRQNNGNDIRVTQKGVIINPGQIGFKLPLYSQLLPRVKAAPQFVTPDKIREGRVDTVAFFLIPKKKAFQIRGLAAEDQSIIRPATGFSDSIELASTMGVYLKCSPPGMLEFRSLGGDERKVDLGAPDTLKWRWEISGMKPYKQVKLLANVKGFNKTGVLSVEKELESLPIEVAKANWLNQWIGWGAAGLAFLLACSLWMRVRSPKNPPEQPASKGKKGGIKLLDEARDHLRKAELEQALELLEKSGKIPSVEMDTLHSQVSRITKELRDGVLTRENYNSQRQLMIRNLLQEIEDIKKGK